MNGISKLLIVFCILVLIGSSCQIDQEFKYKDIFPASTLVVYAFLHENGIELEIKKTLSPLDIYAIDSVTKAQVSLYENDVFLFDLLKNDSYQYISPDNFIPQKDKTYRIKVSADEYKSIESSTQSLPFKVLIDTCKYKGYRTYTTVYVKFTDPLQAGNAYSIGYITYINNEEINDNQFINYFAFNDNDFNNKTYTVEKELIVREHVWDRENKTDTLYKADSTKIFLYSLSNDFKLFLESFVNYDASYRTPAYEQPFQVFSNINNGYGIFGAYSFDSFTIVFNKDSI